MPARKNTTKTTTKTTTKSKNISSVKKTQSAKKTSTKTTTVKSSRSPKNTKTKKELATKAKEKAHIAKTIPGAPKTAKCPTKTSTSQTTKSKSISKQKTVKKTIPKIDEETLNKLCAECMRWQRDMDPSRFNKSTGAQYHTAPVVINPKDDFFPFDLPLEAITFLFRISDEGWIGEPEQMVIENPVLIEKEPRKGAKNGPIFILTETTALCTVAYKENYYWTCNVLAKHQVLRMKFIPEKKRSDGKKRNIVVYATFLPAANN